MASADAAEQGPVVGCPLCAEGKIWGQCSRAAGGGGED